MNLGLGGLGWLAAFFLVLAVLATAAGGWPVGVVLLFLSGKVVSAALEEGEKTVYVRQHWRRPPRR
jgi:hypothetical protein